MKRLKSQVSFIYFRDIGAPRGQLKHGLTQQLGITKSKTKLQKDVEDMIDEGNDSNDEDNKKKQKQEKAKMKKLKNMKKEGEDHKNKDEARTNPKEKLARVTRNIKKYKFNNQEGNKPQAAEGNIDPSVATNVKKEKDKFSNANFLSKLAESEQNHGDLSYGSYIVLNLENENQDPRKFSTKFRISDKVQAIKMDKEDYDPN